MIDASAATASIDGGSSGAVAVPADTSVSHIVPLHAEEVAISRRVVPTGVVRVETKTNTREVRVDEPMVRERVEVERVSIERVVDAVPPVRTEGETTIIPVMEEIVVVEKRLVLKEELRLKRVRVDAQHQETVVLREQKAVVTRNRPETDPGA